MVLAAGTSAAAAGIGGSLALHLALGAGGPRPALALPALHGQAVWGAGQRRAPVFALRDQNGRVVSLGGQRGHTVVLAFISPLCAQCAIEGRGLAIAEQQVAPADRPVLLLVSVNPHANGAEARATARRWRISGNWHWLLGRQSQLTRLRRAYQVARTTAVYLIDARGFERVGVNAPFLPQFVADDFRTLARGAA
jgi:cytochrome oxidase Cu insertion factor (SCO1/SenC/PrrC family)